MLNIWNKITEMWNAILFAVKYFLKTQSLLTKIDPIIYLKNGTAQSKELLNQIFINVDPSIQIVYTDDESRANIIVESKTDNFGFMYNGSKMYIFIPIRNDENESVVNLAIMIFSNLIEFIGAKHEPRL